MIGFVSESFMFSGRKYKIKEKNEYAPYNIYNCLTCPLNVAFCRISGEILDCRGTLIISYD